MLSEATKGPINRLKHDPTVGMVEVDQVMLVYDDAIEEPTMVDSTNLLAPLRELDCINKCTLPLDNIVTKQLQQVSCLHHIGTCA